MGPEDLPFPSNETSTRSLTVAIVMPAYNAAAFLPRSVPAALQAARGGRVLVVDAGATDGSGDLARTLGAEVVTLPQRAGPAEARNAGVAALEDIDVALFVDSDCVARDDIVDRVRTAFAENPDLVSLTGSYDDDPAANGWFSDYMNLRHHHTHQCANRTNATFWSGCGAVRIEAFRSVGGFDAEQFPTPMVEDIELGGRLQQLGSTHLDPNLNVKHLKRWTARSVVTTDICHRAIPWTRLILQAGEVPTDLNLGWAQRLAAPLAPLALISLPALAILAWLAPWWLPLPLGLILASWWLSRGLIRCFRDKRGFAFATFGWVFHQVHLIYSAATFATMSLLHRLRHIRGKPPATSQPRPER